MGSVDVPHVETDFLVCGAGPAGASLACFLSQHGLSGIMIAAAPSTADTPRAHITNMAALECLRDIGLEQACLEQATTSGCMQHTRWCHSMAGEEYGRIYSWGHDPNRMGDYDAASPCTHVDLPQTLLEPILVNRAREIGWDIRFNTTLLSLSTEDLGSVISYVRDGVSGKEYTIRSKYLFGCDGARSQVVRELGLPLIKKPGGGVAVNVLVDVDLSKHIQHRVGNLHWIIQPERDYPDYAAMSVVRMVKPWTRWMFIIFPKTPDTNISDVTEEQWMHEVRLHIGDDSIPASLVSISTWKVNEIVAERYSEGNVFCLGDAVHRHPPFNGLGSNTCIQDAFNLAWKIAYVEKGLASPSLVSTYSTERQPVGLGVITRANQGFRDHLHVWTALGITEPTRQSRIQAFNELKSPTRAGQARRESLRQAIHGTRREFHALGQEMNQSYHDSPAVYVLDEKSRHNYPPPFSFSSFSSSPFQKEEGGADEKKGEKEEKEEKDPILHYTISTYPGKRIPHAWINKRIPTTSPISTIDITGHGAFTLITGPGGVGEGGSGGIGGRIGGGSSSHALWSHATSILSHEFHIPLQTISIGWTMDYEDVYGDWHRRISFSSSDSFVSSSSDSSFSETKTKETKEEEEENEKIHENGCILVRPDRVIAWRCRSLESLVLPPDGGNNVTVVPPGVLTMGNEEDDDDEDDKEKEKEQRRIMQEKITEKLRCVLRSILGLDA